MSTVIITSATSNTCGSAPLYSVGEDIIPNRPSNTDTMKLPSSLSFHRQQLQATTPLACQQSQTISFTHKSLRSIRKPSSRLERPYCSVSGPSRKHSIHTGGKGKKLVPRTQHILSTTPVNNPISRLTSPGKTLPCILHGIQDPSHRAFMLPDRVLSGALRDLTAVIDGPFLMADDGKMGSKSDPDAQSASILAMDELVTAGLNIDMATVAHMHQMLIGSCKDTEPKGSRWRAESICFSVGPEEAASQYRHAQPDAQMVTPSTRKAGDAPEQQPYLRLHEHLNRNEATMLSRQTRNDQADQALERRIAPATRNTPGSLLCQLRRMMLSGFFCLSWHPLCYFDGGYWDTNDPVFPTATKLGCARDLAASTDEHVGHTAP
ncbi:hypothetical protein AC578_1481 [Pseudocercospora eumusae]|uniref:Uncharacterized protein n=1 Tax=Pseudocercospora eumusae TaxID=321146 RepID=A0A139H5H1_9PEZI|nr:hypothetical protein AC578_1481 [Pseudocercospora eumusae]